MSDLVDVVEGDDKGATSKSGKQAGHEAGLGIRLKATKYSTTPTAAHVLADRMTGWVVWVSPPAEMTSVCTSVTSLQHPPPVC